MIEKGLSLVGEYQNEEIEDLATVKLLYRSVKDYEHAEETADAEFPGIEGKGLDEIERRFKRRYKSEVDSQLKRHLGAAFNLIVSREHIRNKDERGFRKFIRFLVGEELLYNKVDKSLRYAEDSFVGFCWRKQDFLTPRRLDLAVFEKYAPQSVGYVDRFTEGDAIAIVSPIKKGTDLKINVYYDKSIARRIGRHGSSKPDSQVLLEIGATRFHYQGSEEKLERTVAKELEKIGIKKPCTIRVDKPHHFNISYYLLFRYLTIQQGRTVNFARPGLGRDNSMIYGYDE